MYDTGLSDLKDYANTVMSLPLTSEGIFGSQFDEKLKEKTERNKQLAECLPNLKSGFKKGKFDNGFKIPKKPVADFKSGATYTAKQNSTNKPWTEPHWTGIKQTQVNAQSLPIILSEVDALLEKGAIETVPQSEIGQGQNVSVCSTMFRPISSSKGVYKDCNSNSRSFKNSECKASDISRRLVTSKYAEIQSSIRSRENTESFNKVGVHCQSRKIIIDPSSFNNIHRGTFQFQKGNCVANSREADQIRNVNSKFNDGTQHSKRLFGSIGFNSIMHRNDPKCSTFYEAYPVTFTTLLETLIKRPTLSNTIYTTPKKSFDMVVRQSQHSQGQITSPVVSQFNNNTDASKTGFGGHMKGQIFSGQMDRNPTIVTHQYSRVRCSTPHSTAFSTSVTGTKCSDQKRQYDSSSVCEQTGGHQINRSMLQDLGLVENGNQKQNSSKGSSHSRSKEYFGGSVVTQQNIPNRMDTERSSDCKRVFNSRPPKVKLVPEWDLHKILDMLQKSPFEPLREAEIKFVTYKVIFLTAITTFRRCSDLQALRIGEGFVNVQSRVKPFKPVSSQTIARWIVNTIKMAYGEDDFKVNAHSTRAIGPSWALFNGASMKSILDSADCSTDTTFT
ncbi:unnamed protein product [Mytilus coruscus]|uniref:Tyr recombinase domain-containing protein n=1 Tax=Mytilus coruscus TaxID=42192 RepID=A0A6J8BB74_MYTCO|nr:unnamed protein product [Mytilus coruscus]